jgi:YD repeat-containing protein
MKQMKWVLAATMIFCGASVFTACSNEDTPVAPEKSLPKISKVYSATMVKAERKVGDQWMTLYENVSERALLYDFQWTGDRLESIRIPEREKSPERLWLLTYDNQHRIINAKLSNTRHNFAYEYDAQGRLARMIETMPWDNTVDHVYTTTYTYNGDKLAKSVKTSELNGGEDVSPTASLKEVTTYAWQGDNVVSMTIESDLLNGDHSAESYSYEYNTLLNPFQHDLLIQTGVYSMAGIKGAYLSKNLTKTTTVGPSIYYYQYITEGDRVVSIVRDNTTEASAIRATTHVVYDLEYVE